LITSAGPSDSVLAVDLGDDNRIEATRLIRNPAKHTYLRSR
jgi:hypothetical protein